MAVNNAFKKIIDTVSKYKYAFLILLIGILLLLVPTGKQSAQAEGLVTQQTIEESMEDKLSRILSTVEGAGEVKVLLSVAAGAETVYQTNDRETTGKDTQSADKSVVTITDAQRNQKGLIKQENPAEYRGIIIVCEGGDNPAVKLELVGAVSRLTGVGADKISVLKMK